MRRIPRGLIGNTESDWNDLGYGIQKSESLITIRLAIDCYDDTHYTSCLLYTSVQ